MKFFYPLIYCGVRHAKTPEERRSILLANILSVSIFLLGMLLFAAYFIWYGWSEVTAAIPVISLLCLSTLIFNKYGWSMISRVFLSLIVPAATLAVSIYSKGIYYEYQEELDYFTFRFIILASCVFPAIFFSLRERVPLICSLAIGFMVLMLHDPLHTFFDVPYRLHVLKETNYAFTNFVIFITYLVMMSAVLFLKRVSENSEYRAQNLIVKLAALNQQLLDKNVEIEAQNHEIRAQTENLNLSQEKLQEAYHLIAEQKDLVLKQNKHLSSELLEINSDLSATNNELIKHNNELRQFSYTVSHNLRGPVASLSGLINVMKPQELTDHNAEIFRHIKTSIDRLEAIIQDLTKIIDIRHEIFHIRQKINLEKEVGEILHVVRKEIETQRILVQTDFTASAEMYSVKPMVHSILYNLITNAIKYRAPDRRGEICISARQENNAVILEVRDNGLGIDLKNQKQNLFKLYKRFHYHTEGRGLGLYLVKLQAEALGGSVEVESEINRFTKFIVSIPKPANIEQQILFNAPHARIFYDARINSTGVVWNGPVSSEQYRNVFTKCLEFIKAYNTPNCINDMSRQGYVNRDDQQWTTQRVMPEAVRYGLKKLATILVDRPDAAVEEYFRNLSSSVNMLGIDPWSFSSYPEAIQWIETENEKASLNS
ncbi:MAG TPA: HAMP domain-containing sensor histidine kinase [Chryseosolibacter sp.]|nr:HAMP domain-containing sensor histidine kinase [Chryseosolibacter sp.]